MLLFLGLGTWVSNLLSHLIILFLLFLIFEHFIGIVDLFKLILVHASCTVRMVLIALLVVHILDVTRLGTLCQT